MTPPTAPTIASKLTTDDSRHDFDRCGPETGPNGERRNPGTCLYPEPAARPLRTRDGCTPRTDPCRGVRRACAGGLRDQPHRGWSARARRSINATEPAEVTTPVVPSRARSLLSGHGQGRKVSHVGSRHPDCPGGGQTSLPNPRTARMKRVLST